MSPASLRRTLSTALLLTASTIALGSAPTPQEDERGPLRFGDPVELAYDVPYFPGASYDPEIPTPEALYGRRAGDRLAHHAEILACFEAWAAASDRVVLREHGRTHEGRALVHAIVTSPANHARLDELLALHARLDDPRGEDPDELEGFLSDLPAVAWMGYSIHGDEVSGCDAAIAVGYHLAAGTDADVTGLLDEVIVVIDPILNPDGRERIVAMVEQASGRAPVVDHATMHRGRWPYGRGNHYLFDMNRDWMAGTQPETRARWRTARAFHPQLFVDAHEMGALDTYLFYPQASPINPHLPEDLVQWQRRFAEGAASAFDALGWSYYTREWADGWAPFYSDAWGSLLGATGMLYEQASARGIPLQKASGRIEPYAETVHHQVVASWANLTTLRANRSAALKAQLDFARESVDPASPGNGRAFVFTPRGNDARERRFLDILAGQDFEVFRVGDQPLPVTGVERWDGEQLEAAELAPGSYVVPAAQPRSAMVQVYLGFDVRMDAEFLQREREALERTGSSKIYDLTSWSLPLAFGLDAAWVDAPRAQLEPYAHGARPASALASSSELSTDTVGWVVDGLDDASVAFAVAALEAGLELEFADEPFYVAGREVGRGSLLVPVSENVTRGAAGRLERLAALEARVLALADAAGVARVHRADTGLADPSDPNTGLVDHDEPDFGGGHFQRLTRPRVAILANAPVESDVFGHLWWWLDHELGIAATQLDVATPWAVDLRRFDVLVAPPGGLGRLDADALRAWVRGGGTLIAVGSAARSAAGSLDLSDVTLRQDALDDLPEIRAHVQRELDARDVQLDLAEVWGDAAPEDPGADADEEKQQEEAHVPTSEEESWAQRFAPVGASVRAYADPRHWLTAGVSTEDEPTIPVHVNGSAVYLTRPGVDAAVRLAPAERLRLSGLVWPEARERLGLSAWATTEGLGRGQVVLFADVPGYRGSNALSARLFANAVVYGPSLGASLPLPR